MSGSRVAGVLAAAILIAWGATLNGWFANDDFLWLDISRPASVLASFAGRAGVIYAFRPVLRVAYLLEWWLFGAQPLGWHLVNLLVQFGCAFLTWRLIAPWLGRSIGALTALLFAVQPVLEENVAWISGLAGSLGVLFGLVSVLCFVRYLRSPRVIWLVAFIAADAAAMSTYEAMILLPLIHCGIGLAQRRRPWRALGGLMLTHAMLLIYRRLVVGSHISYHFRLFEPTSLIALFHDYQPYLIRLAVVPWLLAPAIAALALPRNRDLARVAGIALGVMVLALAPVAVFTGAASRFFYAAAIGDALLCAVALHAVARIGPRFAGVAVAVLMGAAMLSVDVGRSRDESNDWVRAGALGQRIVANVAIADPNPNPEALHLIIDLPAGLGDGELFFDYPDRAMRRFGHLPYDAMFSGQELLFAKGPKELKTLRDSLAVDDQLRAERRLGPLTCLEDRINAASSTAMFLHGAESCGLDVFRVKDGAVSPMSTDEFFAWYDRESAQ